MIRRFFGSKRDAARTARIQQRTRKNRDPGRAGPRQGPPGSLFLGTAPIAQWLERMRFELRRKFGALFDSGSGRFLVVAPGGVFLSVLPHAPADAPTHAPGALGCECGPRGEARNFAQGNCDFELEFRFFRRQITIWGRSPIYFHLIYAGI